jgi:Rrf2 family transcriptional regulator, cysteine metabolism repressor
MNISVKGEYALKALFDLAVQKSTGAGGGPVKIADIARRQSIPQKFLELILAGLKQDGFVESRRGAEGGYLLARPADAITVGEVLRQVESKKQAKSTFAPDDPFADMWRSVDAAVSGILDRTTFAELARRWQEKQKRYVQNWEI